MERIYSRFPNLTEIQKQQLSSLPNLYNEWNEKINVISRKDIENIIEHHILHSLAIAKFINFTNDSSVLDVGTGGGFPGIPLAILFPETHFLLIDSIGKKITVVENIAKALNLQNVETKQERVEKIKTKFDFVVSRAVTAFPKFVALTIKNVSENQHNAIDNGIIYLKGGDFDDELSKFENYKIINISDYFGEEFFETKKIIYLPKIKK